MRADLNVAASEEDTLTAKTTSPVRRPDLNVGRSDSEGGDRPKNFRPDLSVTLSSCGDSSEEDGSGRKKHRKDKKEKTRKDKKGSGIRGLVGGRSRIGSEAEEKERWPTDPALLAKIASRLPTPAVSAAVEVNANPSLLRRAWLSYLTT